MTEVVDRSERLELKVSRNLRRRIETAAAARSQTVSDYLTPILDGTVPDVGAGAIPPDADDLLLRLGHARAAVMRGKRFEDDSTEILNAERQARSGEL